MTNSWDSRLPWPSGSRQSSGKGSGSCPMPSSPFGPCRTGTEANRKEKKRRTQARQIDRPRAGHHPGGKPAGSGILIRYEIIFSTGITDPARPPRWLLDITNDAWFGASSGPFQHFQAARLRAVEQELPVVRVASTGISGIIGPLGRVVASMPPATTASSMSSCLPPLEHPHHDPATATGHRWSSCCPAWPSSPPP
ncbi:MAG: hypothetical protein F4X97_02600 [Boseongicola sp. SB0662_bin_57]|nr:hypothetical protein [Boseongicola sp. SB0662_bin_57]